MNIEIHLPPATSQKRIVQDPIVRQAHALLPKLDRIPTTDDECDEVAVNITIAFTFLAESLTEEEWTTVEYGACERAHKMRINTYSTDYLDEVGLYVAHEQLRSLLDVLAAITNLRTIENNSGNEQVITSLLKTIGSRLSLLGMVEFEPENEDDLIDLFSIESETETTTSQSST